MLVELSSSLNMINAVLIVCALVALGLSHINRIDAADVKLGEIPYQVSIQYNGKHINSGIIISNDWIVTSARRIYWMPESDMKVVAGTVDLREPFSTHQVIETHFYNEVVPDAFEYIGRDVAVLQVSPPFIFSSRVGKAIIQDQNPEIKAKSSLVVSGWGYSHIDFDIYDTTASNILQKATVHVSDLQACRDAFDTPTEFLEEVSFCTNNPVGQTGECKADYGGAVTIDGTLVAMSSWSRSMHGCEDQNSQYLHTQLSEVIDWIREKSDNSRTCFCKCPCNSSKAKQYEHTVTL